MEKNVGKTDRIIRVVVALAICALYFAGVISGWLATILIIVAAILVVTAAVGICPLYKLLGAKTK